MNRGTPTVALTALVILATAAIGIHAEQGAARKSLLNPAGLNETAPATYNVKFDTSVGEFVVRVTRAWAPNGADRFYNLVKNGNDLWRLIQFGILLELFRRFQRWIRTCQSSASPGTAILIWPSRRCRKAPMISSPNPTLQTGLCRASCGRRKAAAGHGEPPACGWRWSRPTTLPLIGQTPAMQHLRQSLDMSPMLTSTC